VLPEQWRGEVAKGFDASALARAMIERGLIIPAGDGNAAKPVKVPRSMVGADGKKRQGSHSLT